MQFGKKYFSIILVISMLFSVTLFQGNSQAAEKAQISKITVTFTGDTGTTKGFTWYTDLNSNNSNLQVVKKVDATPNFGKAMTFTGTYAISTNSPQEHVHKAEATALKPNTTYYYRVGDAALNIWSEVGTFQTAPQRGAFTFIDLADTQAKSEEEAILASQTIAKSLAAIKNAKFLAINGDIVDVGSQEREWNWVLGHSQKSLLNTTLLPVAGNHEEEKNSFIEHFNLKPPVNSDTTTGAYYSVDFRNAHFIVLNNNEDSKEYNNFTPAQIQWMQEDIKDAKAKGAEWIVALMHKGPYTTSNHATDKDILGPNGVRTKVVPIITELGIDLVLQGHDHIYARTKPIKNGTAVPASKITEIFNGKTIEYTVNPDGAIYFIPSTAGPKVYFKNKKIEKIDSGYYELFEVADEHHAGIYGPDPKDKSRPKRSMIQNFSGITIDGHRLTVISYEIDQNKDNAKPYIIDQFGIIKKEARRS